MKLARAAALAALPLPADGSAPKEFRILRAGVNKTEKGEFLFDEAAATSVMAAYAAKGLDKIQIDYEHQSMVPPPGGGPADKPAAGWFKPEVRNGELWATDVAWTARALSMLAPEKGAPEYRYLSPVLYFDEDSRRVNRLKNLALTNDPALDELSPLVAASALEDKPMSCAECSAKDAKIKDLEEKFTALSARMKKMEDDDGDDDDDKQAMSALTVVRDKVVALTGQPSEAAALGTIESWKAKAARTNQLEAERATEQAAALTAQMKIVLDAASKAGKLAPAMRAFEEKAALAFGGGKISKEGVEYLAAKWGAATPLIETGGKGEPRTGTVALSAQEQDMCRKMGTDPKSFLEWKNQKIEREAQEQATRQ